MIAAGLRPRVAPARSNLIRIQNLLKFQHFFNAAMGAKTSQVETFCNRSGETY